MAPEPQPEPSPGRWQLAKDVVTFQFKLMMDGLRDFFLSPVSIVLALFGLITDGQNPGKYFYRLMRFGQDTDRWINLFNAHSGADESPRADDLVKRAEDLMRREYENGEIIKQVKSRTDDMLDNLRNHTKKNQ